MSDPGIDAVETHGETAFRKDGPDANEEAPAAETDGDDEEKDAEDLQRKADNAHHILRTLVRG
jgi:hypothetical protein